MRIALSLLATLAAGCAGATFHGTTSTTLPPIADRAVAVDEDHAAAIAEQGTRVGTVATHGTGLDDMQDLAAKAAVVAGKYGGTHVVVTGSGEVTNTYTTPASETTTCTDSTDTSTCTTTSTPESTTTVVMPYADFDVYRVDSTRWPALPDELRPPPFDPAHHTATRNDGFGETFGYFSAPHPGSASGTSGDVFPTAYTAEPSQAQGLWLSTSFERGTNVLAVDLELGGGALHGMARNTQDGTAAVPYTLDYLAAGTAVRVGKRITFDSASLAGGVGIAGAVFAGVPSVDHGAPIAGGFVEPPGTVADIALPLWTALTIKPSCSWGVQGLAEYDVRPFTAAAASAALAVGLVYQPASACL